MPYSGIVDILFFLCSFFLGGGGGGGGGEGKLYTHPVCLTPMISPFTPFTGEEVSFELELTSVLLGLINKISRFAQQVTDLRKYFQCLANGDNFANSSNKHFILKSTSQMTYNCVQHQDHCHYPYYEGIGQFL
jgi:hypothetical protein